MGVPIAEDDGVGFGPGLRLWAKKYSILDALYGES
jgi:hypothetical protein